MDVVYKQEYRVRDLPTRSVTLFPARAQVVREIKDVPLKPGANQITIVGLTPTVDEHSIKVEGTGAAIISDIAVELLPNRDIFQEIGRRQVDSDSDESDDDGGPRRPSPAPRRGCRSSTPTARSLTARRASTLRTTVRRTAPSMTRPSATT